ncbi:MAG TPA: GNAT family N-acetyltransferase [Beijerinckiaceae bacterium]|jgi:L-amino acid N-acyltransferase YncA|nr:GNAT family N-acetyltransferase [Beijerinckiaceae bacterium]
MQIRSAQARDRADIWRILEPVIRAGETYALPRDMSEDDALAYWLGDDRKTFVAEEDGVVLGTYYLRANQMGGGAHVANCGYVTAAEATGRGIARRMCTHSLQQARELDFRAMQFNCVVSTNAGAVRLWQAMGFETVGRLPGAFAHPVHGFVDAFVMFRAL